MSDLADHLNTALEAILGARIAAGMADDPPPVPYDVADLLNPRIFAE